ncbi:DUF1777-domain-containing protein [Fomitiporia mediterranea MF3/22]|uniref:DUF1777-domain-containing protein n=1 Tax=Fomitiporia mediterranea (strain MF3/22) TaxID=694068 RepID=UPI0004409C35|nr:DUF1777-domain-containing protein [Fomitiporia mediterranea MF3/22]EJD02397.1 DUF1777-domain-containing protein [Fomitiporia mediterranea MF3/22]
MSSRDDRRRRDRSWVRDERDRTRDKDRGGGRDRDREKERPRRGYDSGRRSRSRTSPRRTRRSRSRSPIRKGGERDRRDYGRDRYDDRRDKYRERDRDRLEEHRERDRTPDDKELRRTGVHDRKRSIERSPPRSGPVQPAANSRNDRRVDLDPDGREEGEEEEPMDAENDDDAAMRVLMGFGGFDSTKGKPVTGNEDGAVNIKKQRTWRQYMNRRGGFNRPLDKIK